MSLFFASILGVIQGLTEFLPVSSTAHLTIAGKLLGVIDPSRPEEWTAFIAIMQLGTVAAVCLYFVRDLVSIVQALGRDLRNRNTGGGFSWSSESHLLACIVVGTIPVGVIGLAFKHVIEGALTKELTVIATSLIVLALLLLWAEKVGRRVRTVEQTTLTDALVIGFAQACALIPGSSRSGTTITAALFLGLTREAAARFSFLLSIPAVVASGLFELYQARHQVGSLGALPLIVSTFVSAVVGYACIAFLLTYLKTHSTRWFIVYRIALGGILWAMVLSHSI